MAIESKQRATDSPGERRHLRRILNQATRFRSKVMLKIVDFLCYLVNPMYSGAKGSGKSHTPRYCPKPAIPAPSKMSTKSISKTLFPRKLRLPSTPESISKAINPQPRPSNNPQSVSKIIKPQPQRRPSSSISSARKQWLKEQRLTAWGHDPKGRYHETSAMRSMLTFGVPQILDTTKTSI